MTAAKRKPQLQPADGAAGMAQASAAVVGGAPRLSELLQEDKLRNGKPMM